MEDARAPEPDGTAVAEPLEPLQRGEAVVFGEGRQGVITRAYVLEDKYAVRADGAAREVKGPNNSFFYFKRFGQDLQRVRGPVLPLNGEQFAELETNGELGTPPPEKKPRLEPSEAPLAAPTGQQRLRHTVASRGLDPCITEMPADAAGESRLDGTCTAGQLEAPEPRQGSDSTAADSERDDARICEWDIKVQRTFITVVPRCPQLTHTAARLSMATDLVIATALTANRTSRTGIPPRCKRSGSFGPPAPTEATPAAKPEATLTHTDGLRQPSVHQGEADMQNVDDIPGFDHSLNASMWTCPARFEGRVKWFSKEKGFGKILPSASGQMVDEVFVHKSRFEGGPEGPHAQAVSEGAVVTYEVITSQVDGKPTACNVQAAACYELLVLWLRTRLHVRPLQRKEPFAQPIRCMSVSSCDEDSTQEEPITGMKLLLSEEAFGALKRLQDRRTSSSASSSSTEPSASTDLPSSPEASVLTVEQRLHQLRLALAAPEIVEEPDQRTERKRRRRSVTEVVTMSSSSDGSHTSSDSKPQGQSALYGLIGAVGLVEGADLVVLPALASSLHADLNLTQEDVALLVLVQALCLAAASPVWAALADSASANRKTLMVLGAFLQGLFTCLLPTASAWVPLVALGALNALAKASLRPVSFGLIAEVTREFRGSAFGVLFAALYAGIGLAFWASPRLATHRFLGIEGWRLPVLGVGVISILTSFVASSQGLGGRRGGLDNMFRNWGFDAHSETIPGATLAKHWRSGQARAKILEGWDMIVLQDDLPEYKPLPRDSRERWQVVCERFVPVLNKFVEAARLVDASAILYMAHPYERLPHTSLRDICWAHKCAEETLGVHVAPGGLAHSLITSVRQLEEFHLALLDDDLEHLSEEGLYLHALTIVAVCFGKDKVLDLQWAPPTLSDACVDMFKQLACDSLDAWQAYPSPPSRDVAKLAIGVSVLLQEPAREPPAVDEEQGIRAEFWRLQGYCKFPSFLLLFFQACIMCIPWAAMGYRTLFLKAYGFEDWEVTVLCSSAQGSAALGALCGGVLADLVARFLPIHGRPCVAQASLVLSFPLFILSFLVAPPEGWPLSYEMCLICGSAFVASWTVGACLPMLAELAPWGRKSGILAWQGALEGALGCLVTSSMEVVAPRVFGHSLGILPPLNGIKIVVSEDTSAQDVAGFSDPEDRAHVAKIVVVLMAASWGLCFLCYSMLHWSYPRDLLRAQRLRSEEAEKACALRS
ncbi:cspB [Symbiodinium necroappetens]|uniref:CspB protein n=1 Tax=Symbiodinium necroappetens TaxID=1628268 RepID=A0A813BT92_9DINO|nr:cspB [Symbiodinium necroappetens]